MLRPFARGLTGNEGHDSQGLPSKTENLKISIIK